jgi:hypothetical protein
MKWYRNNFILFGILIFFFATVVYFGCRMLKSIGPAMGKQTKQLIK